MSVRWAAGNRGCGVSRPPPRSDRPPSWWTPGGIPEEAGPGRGPGRGPAAQGRLRQERHGAEQGEIGSTTRLRKAAYQGKAEWAISQPVPLGEHPGCLLPGHVEIQEANGDSEEGQGPAGEQRRGPVRWYCHGPRLRGGRRAPYRLRPAVSGGAGAGTGPISRAVHWGSGSVRAAATTRGSNCRPASCSTTPRASATERVAR